MAAERRPDDANSSSWSWFETRYFLELCSKSDALVKVSLSPRTNIFHKIARRLRESGFDGSRTAGDCCLKLLELKNAYETLGEQAPYTEMMEPLMNGYEAFRKNTNVGPSSSSSSSSSSDAAAAASVDGNAEPSESNFSSDTDVSESFDKNEIPILMNKWNYTRRKNSLKSGSGSSKEWQHMNQLGFLDDLVSFKPTVSNVDDSIDTSLQTEVSSVQKSSPEITKKKKFTHENIEQLSSELRSTRSKTPPQPPVTSDEKFCDYLSSIMVDLPKAKKMKLQAKFIFDVMEEYEK